MAGRKGWRYNKKFRPDKLQYRAKDTEHWYTYDVDPDFAICTISKAPEEEEPEINLSQLPEDQRRGVWEQIKKKPDLRECVDAAAQLANEMGGDVIIKLKELL